MAHALTIAQSLIRQDAEGRYCLNDLHKAAGHEERHQPAYFTRSDSFKGLLDELCNSADFQMTPMFVRGGRGIGTYVCKELVYAYAMWISPKFHIQVIRAYDSLMTGKVEARKEPEVLKAESPMESTALL